MTALNANDLGPLDDDELAALDAWLRACNYLTIGQIYLKDKALLRRTHHAYVVDHLEDMPDVKDWTLEVGS